MRKNHQPDLLASSKYDESYKLLPNEKYKIIKTKHDIAKTDLFLRENGITKLKIVDDTSIIDSSNFLILDAIERSIKKGEGGPNLILPIQKLGMNIDCWNDSGDPGKLFFKMEGGFPSSNLSVKDRGMIYPLISTNDSEICYAEVGRLNDAEILFELIAPELTWPLASVKKDNVDSRILIINGDISSHQIEFATAVVTNLEKQLNAIKISIIIEMIDWEEKKTLVEINTPLTRNLNFKVLISNLSIGHKIVAYRLKNIKITDEHCAVELDIKVNLDDFKSWNILQTSSHDLVLSAELGKSTSNLDLRELVTYNETDGPRYAFFNSEGELEIRDFPNILETSNSNFIENCRIIQGYKDLQFEITKEKIKLIPDDNKLTLEVDLSYMFQELVRNKTFADISQAINATGVDMDDEITTGSGNKVFLITEIKNPSQETFYTEKRISLRFDAGVSGRTRWEVYMQNRFTSGVLDVMLYLCCQDIIKEYNRKKVDEAVQIICVKTVDEWGTCETDEDGMKSSYYLVWRYPLTNWNWTEFAEFYLEVNGQKYEKMKYEGIEIGNGKKTEKVLHVLLAQGIIDKKAPLSIMGRRNPMYGGKKRWEGSISTYQDIKIIYGDGIPDDLDLVVDDESHQLILKERWGRRRAPPTRAPKDIFSPGAKKEQQKSTLKPPPPIAVHPPKVADSKPKVTGSVKKTGPPKDTHKATQTKRKKRNRDNNQKRTKRIHQSLKKQLKSAKRNKPQKQQKRLARELEKFEKENKEILDL